MLLRYPSLLLFGLIAGCASLESDDMIQCTQGACVEIGEPQVAGALTVTALEVIEDSRCPMEARCVWEGEVRLRAAIETRTGMVEHELTTRQPMHLSSGMLQIAEVAPLASTRWPDLQPEDYRFRFTWVPDIAE